MSLGSVLVLDENKDKAQYISSMLHKEKWTSVLSFDQKMAIRILKGSRFHLLLFDSYVDGVSTLDSIAAIRAQGQDAPLALMSEGGTRGMKLASDSDGSQATRADFVLPKPFSPDRLKTLLADTNKYHRARAKDHHVLVVEDDLHLRNEMASVLKQIGYRVSQAANMEDAFFDHNLGIIDVVVTAILIPGIGGIAGITQIRKDWPHVKTIAMSQGIGDKITAMHVLAAAKDAGANELLPKPFTMPELFRAVATVIREGNDTPDASEQITAAS